MALMEQDELYEEEPGGIGRGILFGTILGLVLWLAIIACVYVLFF